MWEVDPDNQAILHFSDEGGRFFLDIGKVLGRMHTEKKFAGNLLHGIRIHKNYSVSFPFPFGKLGKTTTISQG